MQRPVENVGNQSIVPMIHRASASVTARASSFTFCTTVAGDPSWISIAGIRVSRRIGSAIPSVPPSSRPRQPGSTAWTSSASRSARRRLVREAAVVRDRAGGEIGDDSQADKAFNRAGIGRRGLARGVGIVQLERGRAGLAELSAKRADTGRRSRRARRRRFGELDERWWAPGGDSEPFTYRRDGVVPAFSCSETEERGEDRRAADAVDRQARVALEVRITAAIVSSPKMPSIRPGSKPSAERRRCRSATSSPRNIGRRR